LAGFRASEPNNEPYREEARMQSRTRTGLRRAGLVIGALGLAALPAAAQAEWKPTRNIEFIVPAGTGGGADQMARMIQGVVEKNNLLEKSIVVINKSGGAGAEGFLDVKGSAGNPHVLVGGPYAGCDAGARRIRAVGQCQ
jgi:tripartite-type tricarboxylate transporter receptor subunit TctC